MILSMAVLKLTQQGHPSAWINHEQAATLIAKDQVCWYLGENAVTLHGGYNRLGQRSTLEIPAILATKGHHKAKHHTPSLTNNFLFRRDNCQCLYCGNFFEKHILTRDHVIPIGQGGIDKWTNVVTACYHCNQRKGCRTPEQANMPLLAVPFEPNPYEFMYLAARNEILPEQIKYLSDRWTCDRNWLVA